MGISVVDETKNGSFVSGGARGPRRVLDGAVTETFFFFVDGTPRRTFRKLFPRFTSRRTVRSCRRSKL